MIELVGKSIVKSGAITFSFFENFVTGTKPVNGNESSGALPRVCPEAVARRTLS